MENNYKIVVDVKEFQEKILDYINSDELDKMISNTVFDGKPEYKSAIVHGILIALMLTNLCESMYINSNNK